jgi:large subunit ribosomal protein L25
MTKTILKAEERIIKGRKVKKLRKEGFLPGNIYGKKIKSQSVQVNLKDFEKVFKETGETGLFSLIVGKSEKPVLIHNLQLDPVTDIPLHVDFLQVDLKEKIEADIPVELVGESPAEKQAIGTVVQYINEIQVVALPADLPEKFEVDTSSLVEVDQAILVKDLKYEKNKVEIKTGAEEIVAKVEPPQKEEVVAPPAPAEGEVPAEGEKIASEGGETSTEGQPTTSGDATTDASKDKPQN